MNTRQPAMIARSPFDGLQIPREIVCEFFAVFARLEFTMKEDRIVEKGKPYASPDWNRFAALVAGWLKVEPGSDLEAAVAYLNSDPPQVQNRSLDWEQKPLAGRT